MGKRCKPFYRSLEEETAAVMHAYRYDPDTGFLYWENPAYPRKRGKRADSHDSFMGYHSLSLRGKRYKAHRVAYLLYYGHWPHFFIDHINGDRSDNRIENLRDAPQRENMHNKECHREGIIPGICKTHWGYNAQFQIGHHTKFMKGCHTLEEAIQVYMKGRSDYGIPVQEGDLFMEAIKKLGFSIKL